MIGRDAERATIDRWLSAGPTGVLRIEGPAGIGKSTLWAYAALRGGTTLRWRASSAEVDMAFAGLTGRCDRPEVWAAATGLAVPRHRALEVALGRAVGGTEPRLVGLAVADLLRALARAGPVLVAVDDLQWVDPPSESALAFAVRRLGDAPVGFLLTRRTGTAPGSLAEASEVLALSALSTAALGGLIRERYGRSLSRPLLPDPGRDRTVPGAAGDRCVGRQPA